MYAPFLPQFCTVFPSTPSPTRYKNDAPNLFSRLHYLIRTGAGGKDCRPPVFFPRHTSPIMMTPRRINNTLRLFNAPQHSKLQPLLHIPSINSSCIMTERVAQVFFVWKNSAILTRHTDDGNFTPAGVSKKHNQHAHLLLDGRIYERRIGCTHSGSTAVSRYPHIHCGIRYRFREKRLHVNQGIRTRPPRRASSRLPELAKGKWARCISGAPGRLPLRPCDTGCEAREGGVYLDLWRFCHLRRGPPRLHGQSA